MSDRRDKIEKLVDMLENVVDTYQENKDTIDDIVGANDNVVIKDREPMASVNVGPKSVNISIEPVEDDVDEIMIYEMAGDGSVVGLKVGDMDVSADVPVDTLYDGVEASVNNGVLNVKFDREGDESETVIDVKSDDENEVKGGIEEVDEELPDDRETEGGE